MSYISTLQGELEFSDTLSLLQAVQYLHKGKWANKMTIDIPDGQIIPKGEVATINIPVRTYRNLGRNLEEIANLADDGYVVGTSTEVNWHGFIITPKEGHVQFDLEKWITDNKDKLDADKQRPHKEEYDTESKWFEAYSDWQTTYEMEFRSAVTPSPA